MQASTRLHWRSLASVLVLFLSSAARLTSSVAAEEKATSPPPASQPTRDVALDILEIQRQLGGSIVDGRNAQLSFPRETHDSPATTSSVGSQNTLGLKATLPTSLQPTPEGRIVALRAAARQLDQAANNLEFVELYQQADALRTQAGSLRLDARRLSKERGGQLSRKP